MTEHIPILKNFPYIGGEIVKTNGLKILSFLLVLVLATLACDFSFSTANIKDAWLSAQEDGNQRTTVFAPDDTFYFLVQLANAPDDTALKAVWTAVEVEDMQSNTQLEETDITHGDGTITFDLTANQPWPGGKYKVELFLNDESERTLEFEVQGETAPRPTEPTPPDTSQDMVAEIQDAWLTPIDGGSTHTNNFAPADTFYSVVVLTNAPDDTHVKAVWTAVDVEGNEPNVYLDESEITGGSDTYTFHITRDQPWPAGIYKVDLYLNGELGRTLELTVASDTPPDTSAAAKLTKVFMSLNEEGTTPAAFYSPNQIFYVIAEIDNAPEDVVISAQWYVVEVEGEEPFIIIGESEIAGAYESYSFSLTNDGLWPVGIYGVDIYINEDLASELEFEVK
jgi:hypothetical protein